MSRVRAAAATGEERHAHRDIGRRHDLFTISPAIGRGLVTWFPHGAQLRHSLEEFWRKAHTAHGYDLVMTPHLGRADLWGESRQLDFHRETMYPEFDVEGVPHVAKGANCPLHMQVFNSRTRGHRELPVRLAEISTLYRRTPAGALKGLKYARTVSQDDSHIFCTDDLVVEEIVRYFDFARRVLAVFGFDDLRPYLGTRDERSVPGDEVWERATGHLLAGLREAGMDYREAPGGATYYAPRVGIDVVDRHGTHWGLPDLQVDYHLPRMCGIGYTGVDGHRATPVVLHRTLLGSVERFVAALLEHHGIRDLPSWLKPVHVQVVPVREDQEQAAAELAAELRRAGVRAGSDRHRASLGRRLSRAADDGVPLIVPLGDREVTEERYRPYGWGRQHTPLDRAALIGHARRLAEPPDPGL